MPRLSITKAGTHVPPPPAWGISGLERAAFPFPCVSLTQAGASEHTDVGARVGARPQTRLPTE